MALVKRTICKCDRCGHEWLPIVPKPTRCASSKCRSALWNHVQKKVKK